ncbi:MAG: TIM barrel protein [Actinobacteria bacterium]|nr:TIM barrel protein [Actinomycetota bacterium]
MKIAFSKPTRDLARQRELFDGFGPAGYAGLQLKGNQYAGHLADPPSFAAAWGDDPALTSALITMGTLDNDGVARLRQTIAFAGATQAERVVFCHDHPRDGVTPADLRSFARTLSAVGRDAAEHGVALSLHHHYQQPVMHYEDFGVFFSAADHVGLTVDTAHLAKSGITDIPRLIRDFAPVIDNVHLKDYADGQWRLLGQGTLDFPAILTALRDTSYPGWLCVDEESDATLPDGLKVSRSYLRDTLALD